MKLEGDKPAKHDPFEMPEGVERLVSRFLDEECSDEERRQLEAFLRTDRKAEAYVDEAVNLEREAGYALRSALGQAPIVVKRRDRSKRVGQRAALCVAASVAALSMLSPQSSPPPPIADSEPARASWFAPPPQAGDTLVRDAAGDRPQIRLNKAGREWIVVPAESAGEFLVIEVKSTQNRTISIHRDY